MSLASLLDNARYLSIVFINFSSETAPENISPERRNELNRYSGLRYKALIAKQNGAKGLLVVTGPNSPGAGSLVNASPDASLANAGIPVISINGVVANQILALHDLSLKDLQSGLDSENPHAQNGVELKGSNLSMRVSIKRKKELMNTKLDIKKAKKILKWEPVWNLESGIRHTIRKKII